MKPIPVVFHIGPLQVHTYGIGLALTFWFASPTSSAGCAQRLPTDWFAPVFLWIVWRPSSGPGRSTCCPTSATTRHNPGEILAIWHGGLSSFGGCSSPCRPASG
jgi:phosphatidylglycerol:prolipoprotein diacylglycerol transferase